MRPASSRRSRIAPLYSRHAPLGLRDRAPLRVRRRGLRVDGATVLDGPHRAGDRDSRRPKVIHHGGLVAGGLTRARPARHSRTLAIVAALAVAATAITHRDAPSATGAAADAVTILLGTPT